MANLCIMGWP